MAPPPIALRPFGRAQDLELEFADGDRPGLVTALLAGCGETSDAEFWWAQTVGTRIAALLRVLALSEGDDALSVRLRCPAPACGEAFEVALPFAALASTAPPDEADAAQPVPVALAGGRSAGLRRPTGHDLRDWHRTPYASRQQAVAAMLAALVVEGAVTAEDEPTVADAMATHDPLVAFTVTCACPACGAESDHPVDLEAIALARLAAQQRALTCEVHVLASTYGWSERDILAVAPARRARYLALIEDGR